MSKNKYDALSTTALLVLIISTFSAQHFSRAGYLFGALAILSAVGSLLLYIKALPRKTNALQDQVNKAKGLQLPVVKLQAQKIEDPAVLLNYGEERPLVPHAEFVLRTWKERDEKQVRSYFQALYAELKYRDSYIAPALPHMQRRLHVKFGSAVVQDPAAVISNVVERLCAPSTEPRFEFILSPDGSFKIVPISSKRMIGESKLQISKGSGSQLIN